MRTHLSNNMMFKKGATFTLKNILGGATPEEKQKLRILLMKI